MLHLVSEAQIKLKDAHQPRIQFEITLLKLIHMEKTEQLGQLLTELEELKKKFSVQRLGEGIKTLRDRDSEEKSENEGMYHDTPVQKEFVQKEKDNHPSVENEVQQNEPEQPVLPGFEYDLGEPAISTAISQKAKHLQHPNGNGTGATQQITEESKVELPAKKLVLEDVKTIWPRFLESLTDKVPKILELQVQRANPTGLVGHELSLSVDNPLAQRMLEEQEMELVTRLKEHLGVRLRFKMVIEAGSEEKQRAANPYERFKEIQHKDPILRELVERFGAELEY